MKHYLLEVNLLPEQQKINRELEKAYENIIAVVKKISASLDAPELRPVIVIDHKLNPETEATIYECITPYCAISLGADDTGYFNIVYSIHYEAPVMIGQYALSQLIRQINLWTMIGITDVAIEHRVWVQSLAENILEVYSHIKCISPDQFRTVI